MHGPHADHKDPFQKRVAVFLAGYAALLAFTTMLTNQARTSAILLATESSNQWAFFQAKSTKGIVTRAELELLDHLAPKSRAEAPRGVPDRALAAAPAHGADHKSDAAPAVPIRPESETHAPMGSHDPSGHASARADTHSAEGDPVALRARLESDLARYDAEKDEIQKVAEAKAEQGHHQQHREHWFEYAATIVELAIVVAGVSLLANSSVAFRLSTAIAGLSAVITGWTALT